MFLTGIENVDYVAPWPRPFNERLSALQSGDRRVAYFYPRADHSTFRYRVLNMLEAWSHVPGVGASWFEEHELINLDLIVDSADVLVLVRCKYSAPFARLVARARAKGKRVLFDIDDLVFDTRYVLAVLNQLGHPTENPALDYWFADYGRYGAMLQLSDGAVATHEYLAGKAKEFCKLPVAIVPNFMNHAQLSHSAFIRERKGASQCRRDGRIHLGYFSGSPTHQRDFSVLERALLQLFDENEQIVLRIVGQLHLSDRFARFADRIERFPMQDMLNLQRLIAEVEVNLVPLRNNHFTNCKSELKYFEAAAVATPTIASPTFAFARAIRDGVNGYLAPAQSWLSILRRATCDLDATAALADAALNEVLACYTPERQAKKVNAAVFGT